MAESNVIIPCEEKESIKERQSHTERARATERERGGGGGGGGVSGARTETETGRETERDTQRRRRKVLLPFFAVNQDLELEPRKPGTCTSNSTCAVYTSK